MAPRHPDEPGDASGPLAGMRWALESAEHHWARHDRDQVRYWRSRPPAERLAQAASYRARVFGEGPYVLRRTFQWLPSVVSGRGEEAGLSGGPPRPFWQFCAALNRFEVEYLVIGSEAVAFHGVPRFSLDFNLLVRPTTTNLARVKAALEALDLGDLSAIDPEVWARSRALLRVGESPLRIDVLLQISGADFHAAVSDAVDGAYGDVPVKFLGRRTLILNKKASGRPKDLADVDLLTSDDADR